MMQPIAIIDLFSGPGGLGEGFSACTGADGERRYQINVSIEKEASAHRTLRLRAFLRKLDAFPPEYYDWINDRIPEPDWALAYPAQWKAAEDEARCLELFPVSTCVPDLRL
jgi:DNA (cytosine-5)-methyltransferase 1